MMRIYIKYPYCGEETEKGFIRRDAIVQWISENDRPPFLAFDFAKKGVSLVNYKQGIRDYRAEVYECAKCKIVIAPTEDYEIYYAVIDGISITALNKML